MRKRRRRFKIQQRTLSPWGHENTTAIFQTGSLTLFLPPSKEFQRNPATERKEMSSSQQHERRRRQRRSTTSVVATTAATAAVAYGTYRLAQWYWEEDEESQEGTEHPLEEDLPTFSAKEQTGSDNRNQNGDTRSSTHRCNNGNDTNFSWLSSAAVGVASWLAEGSSSFPPPQGSVGNNSGFAPRTSSARSRPQRTRRQNLIRCRSQSRVAFHTCFQTIQPVLEKLTDSSRQTKELKALRRRRQALKQKGQEPLEEKKNGETPEGVCTSPVDIHEKQHERELQYLQEQEEELWRDVLVETTTRMMASSYAYALLLLSLTVQFHWLASTSEFHPDSIEEQQREQEALLMQSHRYFLNEGIPLLVSTVRRSVEKVLFGDEDDADEDPYGGTQTNSWRNPSSQFVTPDDVEQILYRQLPRVLDDLGMGKRQRRRRRNWIRFVLPDEEIFDPVWDICKSPVWEDAQEQVLGYLWYKVLRDGEGNGNGNANGCDSIHGWGKVFRANGTHSDNNGEEHFKKQLQRQPLAKVMTHFKKAASALFEETVEKEDDGRNKDLVGKLQTLPTVLELGDITFQ